MSLVSIGMPVFNDEKFLVKALNSLLSQTFADFELIISDDASSDGSAKICQEYAKADKRITYIRQPVNIGISANMRFLVSKASGTYFMWAGNDDKWDKKFLERLVPALDKNKDAIAAFCPMVFIDENDKILESYGIRRSDYRAPRADQRLRKLILAFDDSFGYGLFRRTEIQDVRFPRWWWINANCAYNNIYPTLCYYLSKGNFVMIDSEPLWFNRLKEEKHVNHKVPFNSSLIRGQLAFTLRKFNLVVVSLAEMYRAAGKVALPARVAPLIIYKWFIYPTYVELKNRISLYRRGKINFY